MAPADTRDKWKQAVKDVAVGFGVMVASGAVVFVTLDHVHRRIWAASGAGTFDTDAHWHITFLGPHVAFINHNGLNQSTYIDGTLLISNEDVYKVAMVQFNLGATTIEPILWYRDNVIEDIITSHPAAQTETYRVPLSTLQTRVVGVLDMVAYLISHGKLYLPSTKPRVHSQ